jgi:PAS domain S-box-containing protein
MAVLKDAKADSDVLKAAGEIEARRKVSMAVEAERKRFLDVLEALPAMVCLLTPDYHVAFANRSFREKFGESQGRRCYEYCFGRSEPCEFCETYNVLKTGQPHHWEVTTLDGSVIDVNDFPFTDADGSPMILEMSIDITERRRAEDALRKSEVKYRSLFDSIDEGFCIVEMIFDPDGKPVDYRFLEVNPAFEKQTGMHDAKGKRMREVVPDHEEHWFETYGNIAKTGQPKRFINSAKPLMGGWYDVYAFPFGGRNSNKVAILFNDITQRKRAEEALRESEERFRALADNIPNLAWMANPDGWIFWYNRQWYDYTGTTPEEMQGWGWLKVHHPDYVNSVTEEWQSKIKTGQPYDDIFPLRGKDGNYRWFLTRVTPIKDEHGNIQRWFGTNTDITERRNIEQALRESEKRLASDLAAMKRLQDVSARFVEEGDLDTLLEDVMDAAIAIAGADMGTLQLVKPEPERLDIVAQRGFEQSYLDFFSSVSHGSAAVYGTALKRGEQVIVEDVAQSPIFIGTPAMDAQMAAGVRAVQSTPLVDRRGQVIGMLSTHWRTPHRPDESVLRYIDLLAGQAADIIERKRGEEALKESEEKFRQLADNSPIPMAINDKDDNITYLNKKFIEVFGYTLEDIPHLRYWWHLAYPDPVYRKDAIKRWEKGVEEAFGGSKEIGPIDYTVTCKDGTIRYAEISGVPIGDKELVLLQDVTERKRAEEALRKSEVNLARAQRLTHLGNWTWDTKRDILEGSAEFIRMFGFENPEHILFNDFIARVHPEDRDPVNRVVQAALSGIAPYNIDYRIVLSDGLERVVHAEGEVIRDKAGRPEHLFGTVQDITERKRAEEELRDAKKRADLYLDLMGHDINNLNQVALGYLELAVEMVKDDEVRDIVSKPLDAIQNSSRLIENVRKLQKVRTGGLKIEAVDLGGLLAELRNQYLNVPGKDVAIDYAPYRDCYVMANGLLRDVFSNLIGNAIKHSGSSKSVRIGLGLDLVRMDGRDYCKVVVEDNGPGIPDMQKEKVFARFRKEDARASGKGLGLYLVKSLVEDFHGTVHVEDRVPGDYTKGARFVVTLPAVEK